MSALNDNPFAVLTAVVAPAILTNACSVLCLGTGNRIARVVDRTRVITAEIASLEVGTSEYQVRLSQLERLQVRAQLLLKALSTIMERSRGGLKVVRSAADAHPKGKPTTGERVQACGLFCEHASVVQGNE